MKYQITRAKSMPSTLALKDPLERKSQPFYKLFIMSAASFLKQFLILGILSVMPPAWVLAQDFPGEPAGQRTFRIGYIRQDPEAATTSGVFLRLREFLLEQPEVQAAMAAAGVDDIITPSFDTHGFLIEAMDAEQVDVAFCSVIDFAYQRGSYDPVFQLRRRGDPHSSTGGRRVWHTGVIFVNNRSPLFDMGTSEALRHLPAYVMEHDIAMVGSSSAAGYIYPYLALERLTTSVPVINAPSVFWDSSSEVVKAVVNGIHKVGACDAMAIDEVLAAHGLLQHKPKLVKELLRTDPVPRDPILMHTRWLGSNPGANSASVELGSEINRALTAFFRREPGLPTLERTSRLPFQEVSENLQRFQALRQATPEAGVAQ